MSRPTVRIGVDLMGCDTPPETLLAALQELPRDVHVVAFGLAEFARCSPLEYVETPSFIAMEESPLTALRKKRDASMCVGLRALHEKRIDALVSAGNTGALVSASKMIVGTLPGILRPALMARLPTKSKSMVVLDVGANVQSKAVHLVQFAELGAAECKARGIQRPVVGLLNIGSEAMKGTSELQQAYRLLAKPSPLFDFAGNIEGKSAFDGLVDVLVTDGFTGNVFLKTAEGVAGMFRTYEQLPHNPGAILIGLKRLVVKCHGYAGAAAMATAAQNTATRFIHTLSLS